jgi:TRAP-type C4-dicarboxylate transport system substrate-binding protein
MRISARIVATLLASFGPYAAVAEETVLRFATLDAPTAHHTVAIHIPWAERINQEGKGVVAIDIRHGMALAQHGNIYSRVLDDVAQIGWGLQSNTPGKFPLSEVVTMPLLAEKSETASVAFWRLYKSGMLDAEYDEIVPLKLLVFPQSGVQFRAAPKSIDDLSGTKMIALQRTSAGMIEALGGTPISGRANELYELLQRGTADGVMIGWTAFQPFKLAEVTTYHIETFLGGSPGMVFMARKKYQQLPAEVRKVLDANATEKESRELGQFFDKVHVDTGKMVRGLPGHTVVNPPPEVLAKWRSRIAPLTDAWTQRHPAGAKTLAAFRTLLAEVEAGR